MKNSWSGWYRGWKKDKVIALDQSLPKSLRKHFVPAPDLAAAFLQTQPNRQQSLKVS
ncbi:MAG: DUF3418 domain-containing protein [Gammaproteobacteria bacterium]